MAQRAIATRVKRQGRVPVRYRAANGETYSGFITNRDSSTQADITYWRGGRRVTVADVPVATAVKQTGRIWHQ